MKIPLANAPFRCEFGTTKAKGALSQAARRGSATRYERCRNKALHEITYPDPTAADPHRTRTVRCCGLHKRLHETQGWLP